MCNLCEVDELSLPYDETKYLAMTEVTILVVFPLYNNSNGWQYSLYNKKPDYIFIPASFLVRIELNGMKSRWLLHVMIKVYCVNLSIYLIKQLYL